MLYVCLHPIVHLIEHLFERQSGLLGLGGGSLLGFEAAGLAEPASSAADLVFADFDFVVLDDADLAFEPSVDSDLAAVSFACVVLGAED